jgi:hypothetical protein
MKKIRILDKIDENEIFIENNVKYNSYNQISIIEKINELCLKLSNCFTN